MYVSNYKMIRMKRILYIFSFLLIFFINYSKGQIVLQSTLPSTGIISKDQLWNLIVINNSSIQYSCRLELILRDRNTNLEVLTAIGYITLKSGTAQINLIQAEPVQYSYIQSGIDNNQLGFLPVGAYNICYSLIDNKSDINLANECITFNVESLSPPMLINPADSSQLGSQPTQFTWMSPTPQNIFSNLQYEILITEVNEGQNGNQAIQENIPFYSENNLINNLLNYPSSNIAFEKGKWYAWQVVAKDGGNYSVKSEVWLFKINTSFSKSMIDQTPFTKMKRNEISKGIAPNGILKLSYVNETIDSIATIRIKNLSDKSGGTKIIKVPIKQGENLITYNLQKILKIQEGKLYEAQIINSRNEIWSSQFSIHFY